MILLELLDVLEHLATDQRELALKGLMRELTDFSVCAIWEAKLKWRGSLSNGELVKHQNAVIEACIEAERSPMGVILRRNLGLGPLSLRTKLNFD